MKKHRKIYFPLILIPFLTSCLSSQSTEKPEPKPDPTPVDPGPIDPGPEPIEEDIYNQGSTTLRIDGETYYQLCEGLYVNHQPGLYKFEFDLKFAFNDDKDQLYFNYSGERPLLNDLCSLSPFEPIEIYENVPTGIDEIPLSTSVDEILDSYNDRCVSYTYIDNVQKTMNYGFFHNACVIDITFVHQESKTDMSLTYLVDSQNEYSIPLISLSMPYMKWFGGPYYFYNNIKEEAESRVHLEYFDPVTKDYWQRNSKIKLGGGWSKGYPQRTLNLNFNKDENGNNNEKVTTAIFGDRKTCGNTSSSLSKHIRFRLHNGGNCFEQWSGFNDAILQRAMFGSNVATTAYRPCLVYLNGE
ncbi:MAG: hypothetical protein IJQ67_01955, partial [Bacilli bacterium]|nr:hypothetical protein [Bacilli bacterium]